VPKPPRPAEAAVRCAQRVPAVREDAVGARWARRFAASSSRPPFRMPAPRTARCSGGRSALLRLVPPELSSELFFLPPTARLTARRPPSPPRSAHAHADAPVRLAPAARLPALRAGAPTMTNALPSVRFRPSLSPPLSTPPHCGRRSPECRGAEAGQFGGWAASSPDPFVTHFRTSRKI